MVDPGYIFVHKLIDRFVENDLTFGRNVFLPVCPTNKTRTYSLPCLGTVSGSNFDFFSFSTVPSVRAAGADDLSGLERQPLTLLWGNYVHAEQSAVRWTFAALPLWRTVMRNSCYCRSVLQC